MTSDGRIIDECRTGKGLEMNDHVLPRNYPGMFLEELRKTMRNVRQNCRYLERDSDRASPECKVRALPIDYPASSLLCCLVLMKYVQLELAC
jgi:hypothetical protein